MAEQLARADLTKTRAVAFVTFFLDKVPYGSSSTLQYRHTVLLGDEWYTLTSISVVRTPLNKLSMRFIGVKSLITFDGTKEVITQRVAELLQYGFCRDCGGQGSAEHRCKNLEIEVLNPSEDKQCTICQDQCKGATRMPCGHVFHWACLNTYYDTNLVAKCPNCRKRGRRSMWDAGYRLDYSIDIEGDDSDAETQPEGQMEDD